MPDSRAVCRDFTRARGQAARREVAAGASRMSLAARPGLSYVVNNLNPGGTERLVVDMSCEFSHDYNVQVICLDFPGAWASELRNRGVSVHTLWRQPGLDASMPAKLKSHFQRHRTCIIHAHQCTPWFYSALSRLSHSEPRLLLQEHGRFHPERK